MEERLRRAARWLRAVQWEGNDTYGAYELPVGAALAGSFLLSSLLPRATAATWLVLGGLLAAAAWYGNQVEYRQLRALGRRRERGALSMGVTWVVLASAAILAGVLLGVTALAGWGPAMGEAAGALFVTLMAGLAHLAQGLRLGVRRRVVLGAALGALAVLVPAVAPLRTHADLATAILVGGGHMACGLLGRREYHRALGRAEAVRGGGHAPDEGR